MMTSGQPRLVASEATKDVATTVATHSVPLVAVTQDALIGKGAGYDDALPKKTPKSRDAPYTSGPSSLTLPLVKQPSSPQASMSIYQIPCHDAQASSPAPPRVTQSPSRVVPEEMTNDLKESVDELLNVLRRQLSRSPRSSPALPAVTQPPSQRAPVYSNRDAPHRAEPSPAALPAGLQPPYGTAPYHEGVRNEVRGRPSPPLDDEVLLDVGYDKSTLEERLERGKKERGELRNDIHQMRDEIHQIRDLLQQHILRSLIPYEPLPRHGASVQGYTMPPSQGEPYGTRHSPLEISSIATSSRSVLEGMRTSSQRIPLNHAFESVTTLEAKKLTAMAEGDINESVPNDSMPPPELSKSTSNSSRGTKRPSEDVEAMTDLQRARYHNRQAIKYGIDARKDTDGRSFNSPKNVAALTDAQRAQHYARKDRKYGVKGEYPGSQKLRKQRQRRANYEAKQARQQNGNDAHGSG